MSELIPGQLPAGRTGTANRAGRRACGHGRIGNRLAERGCHVTGLDATAMFLERTRRDAQARGVTVEYVHGDMRHLPWTGRFDRIVNWFTAFGYFDDQENRQVLAEAARTLRDGYGEDGTPLTLGHRRMVAVAAR
jgi:ubiquinone/menaquinone biosynthesis C-methylase UbiE